MITSLSNPLIKQARALRQKKARLESGLFLVEGLHHVGEVLEAGWDVEAVLYASGVLTSAFAHDMITRLAFPKKHRDDVSADERRFERKFLCRIKP